MNHRPSPSGILSPSDLSPGEADPSRPGTRVPHRGLALAALVLLGSALATPLLAASLIDPVDLQISVSNPNGLLSPQPDGTYRPTSGDRLQIDVGSSGELVLGPGATYEWRLNGLPLSPAVFGSGHRLDFRFTEAMSGRLDCLVTAGGGSALTEAIVLASGVPISNSRAVKAHPERLWQLNDVARLIPGDQPGWFPSGSVAPGGVTYLESTGLDLVGGTAELSTLVSGPASVTFTWATWLGGTPVSDRFEVLHLPEGAPPEGEVHVVDSRAPSGGGLQQTSFDLPPGVHQVIWRLTAGNHAVDLHPTKAVIERITIDSLDEGFANPGTGWSATTVETPYWPNLETGWTTRHPSLVSAGVPFARVGPKAHVSVPGGTTGPVQPPEFEAYLDRFLGGPAEVFYAAGFLTPHLSGDPFVGLAGEGDVPLQERDNDPGSDGLWVYHDLPGGLSPRQFHPDTRLPRFGQSWYRFAFPAGAHHLGVHAFNTGDNVNIVYLRDVLINPLSTPGELASALELPQQAGTPLTWETFVADAAGQPIPGRYAWHVAPMTDSSRFVPVGGSAVHSPWLFAPDERAVLRTTLEGPARLHFSVAAPEADPAFNTDLELELRDSGGNALQSGRIMDTLVPQPDLVRRVMKFELTVPAGTHTLSFLTPPTAAPVPTAENARTWIDDVRVVPVGRLLGVTWDVANIRAVPGQTVDFARNIQVSSDPDLPTGTVRYALHRIPAGTPSTIFQSRLRTEVERPRAGTSHLRVDPVTPDDGGYWYSLVAENDAGEVRSVPVLLQVNHPPTTRPIPTVLMSRFARSTYVPFASLRLADFESPVSALTVLPSSPTPLGGTVTVTTRLQGGVATPHLLVTYAARPPAGAFRDTVTYTVRDPDGGESAPASFVIQAVP